MRISVKVIPNAKKAEIIKEEQPDCFKIKVNQVAEDGKANAAVIDVLADYFQVKKSAVKFISGEKSRKKVFEIL